MSVLPVAKLTAAAVGLSTLFAPGHLAAPATSSVVVTLRVIDRTGHLVSPLDAQLQNLATGNNIDLGTGTRQRVSPGRYNVAAWIGTGTGSAQTFTLEDLIIRVTRNRTVTLDARLGRHLQIRLDAAGAVQELVELTPVINHNWAFNPGPVVATEPGQPVYVVPMTSKLVTFYAYSVWEKQGNTQANPSPFRYDLINVTRGGIPARPIYTVHRSALAKVSVFVRATAANEQATMELNPFSAGGQNLPFNAGTTLGSTPAHVVSFRSPGYQWQPIVDLQSPAGEVRDFVLNMNPYGRGSFFERYFSAVLAPQQNGIFDDVQGRQLQIGLGTFPLGDPLHADSTDQGSGLAIRLHLFSGGRLLATSRGGNLNLRIPAASHWYTLHLDTTRRGTDSLSTQLHQAWHFTAHGTTGGFSASPTLYMMQLQPGGLDAANRAAPGALTLVALRVFAAGGNGPVRLPVVRALASGNGGKTWRAVRVKRSGDHYVFSVADPRSAGSVALQVFVRDAAGIWSRLTVIHAYGVR